MDKTGKNKIKITFKPEDNGQPTGFAHWVAGEWARHWNHPPTRLVYLTRTTNHEITFTHHSPWLSLAWEFATQFLNWFWDQDESEVEHPIVSVTVERVA